MLIAKGGSKVGKGESVEARGANRVESRWLLDLAYLFIKLQGIAPGVKALDHGGDYSALLLSLTEYLLQCV